MHTGVKNRGFIIDALLHSISYSYKLHILRFGVGPGKHVWNILIWMCVVRKKMVPLIILLTACHMLVFTLCNGTSWFNMEFSVDHYLLFWEFTYWQRWNQVSLLNRWNVGSFFRIQSTKVPVHKIEVCFMMCPRVYEPQLFYGSNADGMYKHDILTPKVCVWEGVAVVGKLVSGPSCRKWRAQQALISGIVCAK
jgi:hypothetical protein